jgi:hypothetical protein
MVYYLMGFIVMHFDLLQYYALRNKNRDVFLLNYSDAFAAFENIDKHFQQIIEFLSINRTKCDRFQITLIPFILIIILQGRNAFESLARYQSSDAWLIFRPGLEAVLFMGKFVDNPENAKIWQDRHNNRKKYDKISVGKGLISDSLPRAKKYQKVLKQINDRFIHSNYDFYMKNLSLQAAERNEIFLAKEFFDRDADIHEANLLSFLNLIWLIGESIGEMFLAQYN